MPKATEKDEDTTSEDAGEGREFMGWILDDLDFFSGKQKWQGSEDVNSPICFMYGIFTYIWLEFMVNVGRCLFHTWSIWEY